MGAAPHAPPHPAPATAPDDSARLVRSPPDAGRRDARWPDWPAAARSPRHRCQTAPRSCGPQPATRRSRWALLTSIPAKYLKSPELVLPCIGAIMPLHQSRPLRKARHGHATDGTESQGCARPKPTVWGRRPPSPHIPKLGQFKDKRNMQGCAFMAHPCCEPFAKCLTQG